MIRPASARPAPPSPVLRIWDRAMWPVTIEVMISANPPMPMKCPSGAAIAVTRLTTASVFVWPGPAVTIDPGVPIGTLLEGVVYWPTIWVGAAIEVGAPGGGGSSLEGVLMTGRSLNYERAGTRSTAVRRPTDRALLREPCVAVPVVWSCASREPWPAPAQEKPALQHSTAGLAGGLPGICA